MTLIDPDGKKAKVYRRGDTIRIEIPSKFFGDAASSERIDEFKSNVEMAWSGKFGRYTVTTTVTEGGLFSNRIVLETEDGRSSVRSNKYATLYTKGTPEEQAYTDSHEAAHLMNLRDRYTDDEGPDPGWGGNIMGEFYGVVTEDNIDEVLEENPVKSLEDRP